MNYFFEAMQFVKRNRVEVILLSIGIGLLIYINKDTQLNYRTTENDIATKRLFGFVNGEEVEFNPLGGGKMVIIMTTRTRII
jgi:hypothetical protein